MIITIKNVKDGKFYHITVEKIPENYDDFCSVCSNCVGTSSRTFIVNNKLLENNYEEYKTNFGNIEHVLLTN